MTRGAFLIMLASFTVARHIELPIAAALGNPEAQYNLASKYSHGDGIVTKFSRGCEMVPESCRSGPRYEPFGALNPAESGTVLLAQDLRLPGQVNDIDTGLFNNGFREYVPRLGRYTQSDPIGLGGGLNTFEYARGNPIVNTDMAGTSSGLDLFLLAMTKFVIDPAFAKGENLLGQAWVESFWSRYGVPLIGDKDYSPVVKAGLSVVACITATQGVGTDCAEAAERANQEEIDRKLDEATRLWWQRHQGSMCRPGDTP